MADAVCIATGTFGQVYKVTDAAHGVIARKLCVESCDNEITALNVLKSNPHENVVRVLRILPPTADKPVACFDMELCDMDLYGYLETHDTMTEAALKPIAKQIIAGMMHCISSGVYHGDFKPENVLLKNGVAKLADFGFAAFTPRVAQKTTMTAQYASPELVCTPSLSYIDVELSDVWSFGITLAVCVTGFLPMETKRDMRVCARFRKYIDMCAKGKNMDAVKLIVLGSPGRDTFSFEFLSLLCECLNPVFYKRPRFATLSEHSWILA